MIKFYLDNGSNLHIIEEGQEEVKYIPYGYWEDKGLLEYLGEIETLQNKTEYHLNEMEVYDLSEFREFEETEDGFVISTIMDEKTINELIEMLEE